MNSEALSKYSILFNNCGHAVNKTLNQLGIRTEEPKKYEYGSYNAGYEFGQNAKPNVMYENIKEANKKNIVTIVINSK